MRIVVSAKPNSKGDKVEKIDDTHFRVWVKEPPVKGRANAAIVKLLASHFGVRKNNVRIVSGLFQKKKVIEVL